MSTSADSEVEEKCGVKISGKYPTNLRAHLRKCHPKEYEDVQEKKVKENEKEKTKKKLQTTAGAGPSTQYGIQPTLVATLQMKKKYSKENEKYRKITRKLAIFIGTSNVANSIVESLEFCEFVSELDQQYPVPGRAAISSEMDKVLFDMKQQITGKLAAARRINICVDIWTKRGMSASFLGITAHFFSRSDHKRHRVTIAVKRMPSPRTANRVSELVKTVLQEWEIPEEKVGSVLTDNDSNMVAAFKQQVCSTNEDMDGRESTAEESNDMYDTKMETGETETRLTDEVQKEIYDFDDKEIAM